MTKSPKSYKTNYDKNHKSKLIDFRKKIDAIDDEILNLIISRAQIAEKIGKLKNSFNNNTNQGYSNQIKYAPERLSQIIRRLQKQNSGPLPDSAISTFFNELISSCLALEQEIVVAHLGPKGTHTEAAVRQHFGHAVKTTPLPSVIESIREVELGKANYTVVPVENSIEGSVGNNLDLLATSSLIACGEIVLAIHHHLLTPIKKISSIKRVFAHPQTFGQSRNWLKINIPKAELISVASNAAACEEVSKNKFSAAIAGKNAAEIYELPILAEAIEDSTNNTTRFLVLGKNPIPASGFDRTSMVFSAQNVPGSLYQILENFAKAGISMCSIQSRPAPKSLSEDRSTRWQKNWEYLFFIDIEGHRDDSNIKKVIGKLESKVPFFKLIGSYPRNHHPLD